MARGGEKLAKVDIVQKENGLATYGLKVYAVLKQPESLRTPSKAWVDDAIGVSGAGL